MVEEYDRWQHFCCALQTSGLSSREATNCAQQCPGTPQMGASTSCTNGCPGTALFCKKQQLVTKQDSLKQETQHTEFKDSKTMGLELLCQKWMRDSISAQLCKHQVLGSREATSCTQPCPGTPQMGTSTSCMNWCPGATSMWRGNNL